MEATPISCSGFSAKADATRDRLVVVLPTACYPGSKSGSAGILSQTLKWNADTWPDRNSPDGSGAEEYDGADATWSW